jgi:hypothetical protein
MVQLRWSNWTLYANNCFSASGRGIFGAEVSPLSTRLKGCEARERGSSLGL